jgi:hypothetical protein
MRGAATQYLLVPGKNTATNHQTRHPEFPDNYNEDLHNLLY